MITSPDAFYPQRLVSVPQDTIGVAPGTSLYLWGKPMSPLPQNGIITGIGFHWETNYDAAVMRVDLLMCDPEQCYTTVWSQNKSGFHWGIPDVNISISPTTYQPAFRITVIPEASGLPVILAGFGILATRMRRSKSKMQTNAMHVVQENTRCAASDLTSHGSQNQDPVCQRNREVYRETS